MKEEIKPIETFYPDGKIQSRTYRNAKGECHRDPKEGPAYEAWYPNGQLSYQKYYVDGNLHRDQKEGPALQSWKYNGQLNFQQYYVEGKAVLASKEEVKMEKAINPIETFYPDGKIQSRRYYNAEGKLHRNSKEGLAYEVWYDNGQIAYQQYWVDGKLHRDPKEGPATESWHSNGQIYSQQYWVDGKIHRDQREGFASQFWTEDGQVYQYYYVDGKEVPPPIVEVETKEVIKPIEKFYPDGKIQSRAYENADKKLHKDPKEGPAVEHWYDNGQLAYQQYCVDGQFHRDPKEGPAYQNWYKNGQIGCQEYWVDGKRHRDPKEGPAFQSWKYNGQLNFQQYWVEGKEVLASKEEVKMEKAINPIETFYPDGKIQSRTYYNTEGKLHRNSKEGLAFEEWYDSGHIAYQSYYENGKRHRDPKEGPAYQNWYENGQIGCQEYWVDGKRHRDPKEGPAYTERGKSGEIAAQSYYVDGRFHRDPKEEEPKMKNIKPIETFYPDGKIQSRTYKNAKGECHRNPEEGPAYEVWHKNGQIYIQQYYVDGKAHRDPKEGPVYTEWHENGQIASQQYFIDGKAHRDPKEGPAYQSWYDNGQNRLQEYWVNGKRHRDPKEGPAYQSWHKNGENDFQQYWIEGKEVSAQKTEEEDSITIKSNNLNTSITNPCTFNAIETSSDKVTFNKVTFVNNPKIEVYGQIKTVEFIGCEIEGLTLVCNPKTKIIFTGNIVKDTITVKDKTETSGAPNLGENIIIERVSDEDVASSATEELTITEPAQESVDNIENKEDSITDSEDSKYPLAMLGLAAIIKLMQSKKIKKADKKTNESSDDFIDAEGIKSCNSYIQNIT